MKGFWFSGGAKGLLLSIIGALVYLAIIDGSLLFAQEQRQWRDNTGTFEVEAILQSFDDDAVVLKLLDGRTVKVPFRRLSGKDREYVQNVRAANAISKRPTTKPPTVEPKPPLLVAEPKPSIPTPDPATASPVEAKRKLPPAFSMALDPAFERYDDPPSDWIPSEPKLVAQPADRLETNSTTTPSNPEKLKLIGISPSEPGGNRQKIAASPVSEKQIRPDAGEFPENNAQSLVPEPVANVGPGEMNSAETIIGNSPSLTPAASTGPRIIAPERAVASEPIQAADPATGSRIASGTPERPSMALPLQATLNSLLAELKVTTDNEALRRQLVRLSQLSVPLNDPPTLEVLRQHMTSSDKYIRETVLQKIISLSSRLDSETLRLAVVDESQAIRWKAYDMLIADPRPELLPLLLERAPDYDRNKILSTIGSYGAAAESSLWPLLESDNGGFRLDITRLLSDVGTENSLPYLTKSAENDKLPLVEVLQAKSSIRKIESRQ